MDSAAIAIFNWTRNAAGLLVPSNGTGVRCPSEKVPIGPSIRTGWPFAPHQAAQFTV